MEKPVLQIAPKKYTGESAVVSVRMPKDMLKDIDEVAAVTGRTRNEVLLMSLEFSLQHMAIVPENTKEILREAVKNGNY